VLLPSYRYPISRIEEAKTKQLNRNKEEDATKSRAKATKKHVIYKSKQATKNKMQKKPQTTTTTIVIVRSLSVGFHQFRF